MPQYCAMHSMVCTETQCLGDISDRHKWLYFRFLSSFYHIYASSLHSLAAHNRAQNFHNEFSIALCRLRLCSMTICICIVQQVVQTSHFEGCHWWWVRVIVTVKRDIHRTSNGKCITDIWMEHTTYLIKTDSVFV